MKNDKKSSFNFTFNLKEALTSEGITIIDEITFNDRYSDEEIEAFIVKSNPRAIAFSIDRWLKSTFGYYATPTVEQLVDIASTRVDLFADQPYLLFDPMNDRSARIDGIISSVNHGGELHELSLFYFPLAQLLYDNREVVEAIADSTNQSLLITTERPSEMHIINIDSNDYCSLYSALKDKTIERIDKLKSKHLLFNINSLSMCETINTELYADCISLIPFIEEV